MYNIQSHVQFIINSLISFIKEVNIRHSLNGSNFDIICRDYIVSIIHNKIY